MPKLYLLGGENIYRRSAQQVNEQAFLDAGKPACVAVVPWARASFDKTYLKRKVVTDYFLSLGADNVEFVDYSDSKATIKQKFAASNLVYLTGGLASALVERLQKTGVDKMLRSYPGIVVGRSAGALALCRRCIITCRHSKKVLAIDGLGLADFTLKAHYKPMQDPTLTALSMQELIYAVPSRSAIVYENGKLSFMGEVYVFENGVRRTLNGV